ncbi:hypothetical protein HPB52_001951 [Rhipicephalus sanguineus]|uniref:Uncharacterized protein n=1 Tax=Rhipicephalus sanguineus TaxID=34632 RepID=A0A9D4PTT8_RHISA|nr:hypothetical protein HPB52_001951 [Rhipicephalus sanguineus]
MDTTQGSASAAAGKRPHEQTTSSEPQLDDGGGDEPPTKAPVSANVRQRDSTREQRGVSRPSVIDEADSEETASPTSARDGCTVNVVFSTAGST